MTEFEKMEENKEIQKMDGLKTVGFFGMTKMKLRRIHSEFIEWICDNFNSTQLKVDLGKKITMPAECSNLGMKSDYDIGVGNVQQMPTARSCKSLEQWSSKYPLVHNITEDLLIEPPGQNLTDVRALWQKQDLHSEHYDLGQAYSGNRNLHSENYDDNQPVDEDNYSFRDEACEDDDQWWMAVQQIASQTELAYLEQPEQA
ncbi:hypothetical protein LIER_41592 [Lithospermum erythrorhizon]|uniref:Uncharacterized protein n=1 Tax=Lithospermum erythrorhizon TaxID=34254 RepID=A0AAV3RDA9_LITER